MFTLYGSKGLGSGSGSGSAAVEAALLKVNPLRQVPTLQLPEGDVMTESAAILIHGGPASPASGLLTAGPAAQAQAWRGLVCIAANCHAAMHKAVGDGARPHLHERRPALHDVFERTREHPMLAALFARHGPAAAAVST